MSEPILPGTTVPTEISDELIQFVQKRFPNCHAIILVLKEGEGPEARVIVETITSLPQKFLIGLIAKWAYEGARELGKD